jgi:hypothetical protein
LHLIPPSRGGASRPIPVPRRAGIASPELISAITDFQILNMELRFRDGRVESIGPTLDRLNAAAAGQLGAAAADHRDDMVGAIASLEDRNEEDARQHILRALRAFPAESEQDRLFHAFRMLLDERNAVDNTGHPMNCGNRPLAYAEHYLLCRWFVSLGHVVPGPLLGRAALAGLMMSAVLVYDLVKLLNFIASHLERWTKAWPWAMRWQRRLLAAILKAGVCPVSDNPPDWHSINWGHRGLTAGLVPLSGDPTF